MGKTSLLLLLAAFVPLATRAAPNLTNTVLMVDQRGELNVDGVASVKNVASNSAAALITLQKAEIAQSTSVAVSNTIDLVVQNLMANNEVVYRSGFSDAFSPLVIFTDSDVLAITEARWVSRSAAQLVVDIDYVCTVDIGAVTPTVMMHNSLAARADFSEVPAAGVSTPVYTAQSRTYGGQTFAGYYTVRATLDNPGSTTSYFLWIKAEADAPSGAGATLDLANGVTGGASGTVTWGDKTLTFLGGVLMGVE